jgi:hypothetical protein
LLVARNALAQWGRTIEVDLFDVVHYRRVSGGVLAGGRETYWCWNEGKIAVESKKQKDRRPKGKKNRGSSKRGVGADG